MKYIDKSVEEEQATTLINRLLEDCWNEEEQTYNGADYDTLKKPTYKDPFPDILLREQKMVCCYCMKALEKNTTTTIEHIIPESTDSEAKYNKYSGTPFLDNHVMLSTAFDRKIKVIPPEKYPHDIAYHNLAASCNSTGHCNHYRGDKFIRPFFFDQEIDQKVSYDSKGIAFSDEYLDDMAETGISVNENLILYRWIWAEISSKLTHVQAPSDVSDDDIMTILCELDLNYPLNRIANNLFGSPSKKPDLLKYSWFFYYYKNKQKS